MTRARLGGLAAIVAAGAVGVNAVVPTGASAQNAAGKSVGAEVARVTAAAPAPAFPGARKAVRIAAQGLAHAVSHGPDAAINRYATPALLKRAPAGHLINLMGLQNIPLQSRFHIDAVRPTSATVTMTWIFGSPVVNRLDWVKTAAGWRVTQIAVLPAQQPAAPSRLRVIGMVQSSTSAQQTTVSLQWQDNARDETGFRIRAAFVRTYGGSNSQVKSVPANATRARFTFIAGGINPTSKACFTVSAVNPAGESRPSNSVCVML